VALIWLCAVLRKGNLPSLRCEQGTHPSEGLLRGAAAAVPRGVGARPLTTPEGGAAFGANEAGWPADPFPLLALRN